MDRGRPAAGAARRVEPVPGLLGRLHDQDLPPHAGAEVKLRHFGLWDHFPFGGFADGIEDRDDVARQALAEAVRHVGRAIDPADVWVIGDTPLDVKCARAIGAKAVVVQTGWHRRDELVACCPDHLLPDFTHAGELLTQWGWI